MVAAAPPAAAGSRFRRLAGAIRRAAWPIGLAIVSLAAACVVFRVWARPFGIPVNYGGGDAMTDLVFFKNFGEGHWWFHLPRLGAPFVLDMRDFPIGGENLHWVALRLLALVLPSPGAIYNSYLLLSYPVVAVVSYGVLRQFRVVRPAAAVSAFLFAFLPYHQWRAGGHLVRTPYIGVPLGALAVLWILSWTTALTAPAEPPAPAGRRWNRRRLVLLGGIGVLIASTDTQNSIFTVVLVLVAALAVAIGRRNLVVLGLAFAFSALIGVVLVANNVGYLEARLEHGANPEVAQRVPAEQEIYGLRTAYLLLPITGHRFPPFAHFKADAVSEVSPGEDSQALGIVFSTMFVVGGLAALGRALGAVRRPGRFMSVASRLGALQWTVVAIASAGGLSLVLTFAGVELLRTWNRMSVWIAFLAAVMLGVALNGLIDWLARRRARPAVAWVLLGAIALAGWLDATPRRQVITDPGIFRNDQAFYAAAEHALGDGAAVYQLPFMEFPESRQVVLLPAFAPLGGMITSDTLRFSGGAMRGQPEGEWVQTLDSLPRAGAIGVAAASGFDGLEVDERGFTDGDLAALDATIAALGLPTLAVSPAHWQVLYDLRPLRARLGGPGFSPGALTVPPVVVRSPADLDPGEWAKTSRVVLSVLNPASEARHETFIVEIDHANEAATVATLRLDTTGTERTVRLRQRAIVEFDVPPGGGTLTVTVAERPVGSTPRGVRVVLARAIDPALRDVSCASAALAGVADPLCAAP